MINEKHNWRLRRYLKEDKIAWNQFVEVAKNGLFLFDRNYMDYHSYKFHDHSLMITRGEKLVAVFPAIENGKGIVSHDGLSFGGVVLSPKLGVSDVIMIFDLIMAYYRENGFEIIKYKTIPHIYHKYPSGEDLYALFRSNATLIGREISSVLNLRERSLFSGTNRRTAARSGSFGIKVVENTDFAEYWELLTKVLVDKYKKVPVHSLEEISLLRSRFTDKIRLFEAREGDQLLAGVVIYDYGLGVRTQYMANSERGREIRALDNIILYLINNVYQNRQFFSFGPSNEQRGTYLNEGLVKYKELMGGRGVVIDTYLLVLNGNLKDVGYFQEHSMIGKDVFIHPKAEVQSDQIADGTSVWQFAIILKGAVIGGNCNINCHTFIEGEVVLGNHVTIKAGVYLWDGITMEDGVFVGPNVTFTNDKFPRSKKYPQKFQKILVKEGASIGANATVLGGVILGRYSVVGAGSVVTKHVPDFALVKGVPAIICGWVDKEGDKLKETAEGILVDKKGVEYVVKNNELIVK